MSSVNAAYEEMLSSLNVLDLPLPTSEFRLPLLRRFVNDSEPSETWLQEPLEGEMETLHELLDILARKSSQQRKLL